MKLRVIATLVAVLAFGVGSASAQSIGIFADPGSASCNITASPYVAVNFYINAVGSSVFTPQGIAGAEFRVDQTNIPVGTILNPTASPNAGVTIGGPLSGGCNIGMTSCQVGPSVLLYTVQMILLAPATDGVFKVEAHTTPSNPNFACSLLNKCDVPFYTAVCVPGGSAFVNSSNDCTVAVEEATWSKVKNLFN